MNEQSDLVRHGDELKVFNREDRVTAQDFSHDHKSVIVVHGFTSHSKYLRILCEYLRRQSFDVLVFNYNSYRGIEAAAKSLLFILNELDSENPKIGENGLVFVAHSMGGLVVRALAQLTDGIRFVKGIATLGTPHSGSFMDNKVVDAMLTWAEHISGLLPGFTKGCQSALELTGNDSLDDESKLLIRLKTGGDIKVPVISISGGKEFLEFSNNPLLNFFLNRCVKNAFGDEQHDGLVMEASANFTLAACQLLHSSAGVSHFNDYPDYLQINHTHLVNCNQIALRLANWIRLL